MIKMNRRNLLQSMSVTGLFGSLLAYQNCSNVGFSTMASSSSAGGLGGIDPNSTDPEDPNACGRPKNLFDVPAKAPTANAGVSQINGRAVTTGALANAKYYATPYYDIAANTVKTQYLLTVDALNAVGSSNFANLSFISDIYVFRKDSGELVYWKRLGDKSLTPSTMIMLDEALVAAQPKLAVVVYSEMSGYDAQVVDLAQSPLDYKTAVATFNAGAIFGGSTVQRPYVSKAATGGQNDIGAVHAPHFHVLTDTEVQCTLGPKTTKHGRAGETHYMAAALLFDQNGNLLGESENSYAMSSNHNFAFKGLNLSQRNVTALRCVILDTYNGVLMGFTKVA